jgi:hypothetical protein
MQRVAWIAVLGSIACGKVAGNAPDAPPAPPPDGAVVPGDEQVCFGRADRMLMCLLAAPQTALTIDQPIAINTDTSTMCAPATGAASAYCVITATDLTISSKLLTTGSRPLVLIASRALTVTANGVIDVGSHATSSVIGAGADPVSCLKGTPPKAPGGGAGGSFLGLGGAGGQGGLNAGVPGGVPGDAATVVSQIRGGCPGQNGTDGAGGHGTGGHGGGAVYLIADTSIDITGTILATGQGGHGGTARQDINNPAGSGAGGGAGGMIGLDAPSVTIGGVLLANGGGGGGGGSVFAGNAGGDASTPNAAAGGGADSDDGGGNGGNGSPATSPTAPGMVGRAVTSDKADPNPGGGGGGGGAGLILVPAGAKLGTTSPPVTTFK